MDTRLRFRIHTKMLVSATLLQAHHEGGEVGAERSVLYGDRGEQVRHQVQEQEAGSAGEWIVKQ